ncbi:hypothetical protein PK35_05905 [Tamlana nanhaiensis]|uniref:Polysaccharide pyruvyl transferase domain-containing protein n=1 Tax=Neotamlana nanhaiensis TaxID=1382798 RepID=A0A0D7W2S6_9FLAO|nr:polysaccharide pyruvyl transferase family protein [Tamlana nanhaiensis]KJD33391.1 hypothetical protein PK35_05905 [Tamlana nanhaiensis]
MKVLLVNDTRIETNPGCHATVSELINFVEKSITITNIDLLNLGSEYDIFPNQVYIKNHKIFRIRLLKKLWSKIKVLNSFFCINIRIWKQAANYSISDSTKNKILNSDLVIVNMEGTIHDNSISGLALLAITYFAKRQGRYVAMVNGTYQNMDKRLSRKVLNSIDFLSVREPVSYDYLKKMKIRVNLIPDFAFLANINSTLNFTLTPDKKCLYTVGVLGVYPNKKNGIKFKTIETHIEDIKRSGFKPYYLQIEEKEDKIVEKLKVQGINVISLEAGVNYKNIGSLLSDFNLLITGRYHVGIFGLMVNTPTLFLNSNTYKIEGLLKLLNLDTGLVYRNNLMSMLPVKYKTTLPDNKMFDVFRDFLIKVSTKD